MRGRLEHKMKMESDILEKISDMPDYIQKFYYSLRQKSHTTKKMYINNLLRFLYHKYDKLPDLETVKKIDSYDIQMYLTEIEYYDKDGNVQELKEASQAAICSALSAFFTFFSRTYGTVSPFANKAIERPPIPENPVVFLTPEEVRKVEAQILNGVGNQISVSKQEDWKYRDLLLFRIPIVNGIRVTALCEINIEDIDLVNRKIKVTEKRNITKEVGFDVKTANYLAIWLRHRRNLLQKKGVEESALFISNRRTRMTVRAIEKIINKYTVCVPDKHITPHKLRSTCGTNVYQKTKDIYLVSKVLGHKNTTPTRRYAAVFNTDIEDAINSVANLY